MGELSVNINNDDSIFMEDQSVEKGDLVHTALVSNGYPSNFIKNIQAKKTRSSTTIVSPEELVGLFFKMVEPTEPRKSFASFPYIKGVTEPLTRVLKNTMSQL